MKLYFLVFLFSFVSGFSQPDLPKLKMWATDLTGTLSQNELSELNVRLKYFQDTTSNQIVVLMIPTLDNYPIEMLAEETATKNKIGTEKNDNGILLLIAKDDRELRLEVGYGLEGAVPDAIASSIVRNVIRPRFKDDNYYLGISDGINAIIKAIGGEYKIEDSDEDSGFPFIILVIIMIVVFSVMRGGSGPFVPGGVYRTGTRSGGWSSGTSSWGGSSGGFSGGGGSFGGGGASGSW
ncbi:MAG: TPM domain-containing protein [Ignavibacteriaceae bacterium]